MKKSVKSNRIAFIGVLVIFLLTQYGIARDENVHMYVMDGQIISRPFIVCVPDMKISGEMDPVLLLRKSNLEKEFTNPIIAPNQQWILDIKGKETAFNGTVLLFNISDCPIDWYSTGMRILPMLSWTEPGDSLKVTTPITVINDHEVYIGNIPGAIFWTFLIFCVFFTIIWLLTRHDEDGITGLISTVDGNVSLSLVQMALWTIAVGLMVLAFGLMQLKVPHIPESLVILMGLSVGTSVVGHYQAHRLQREIGKGQSIRTGGNNQNENTRKWNKWQAMLMISVKNEQELSIAKAQMFFWTLIVLIIFILKSFTDGKLWDVPNELILLMGISQATFLGRKEMAIYEEKKSNEEKVKNQKKNNDEENNESNNNSNGDEVDSQT